MFTPELIKAKSAHDAWEQLYASIKKNGKLVEARGELTKEILNPVVEITNPYDRITRSRSFDLPFILQEAFDILNENQPRSLHSKEMLEKTMGTSNNIMFFGNEMRQACSKWSLVKLKNVLEADKNTRKAILDLGSRRPAVHYPCLIYFHLIIRENKLCASLETRSTSLFFGLPNDIFFFTLLQQLMLGWLKETYPELEMGTFLYKTTSCHYYCDKAGNPFANSGTHDNEYLYFDSKKCDLSYKDYIAEMGRLYFYVDQIFKAQPLEDIDAGVITTNNDVLYPLRDMFQSSFFYSWANELMSAKFKFPGKK